MPPYSTYASCAGFVSMALISFPPLASAECGFDGEFCGEARQANDEHVCRALEYAYRVRADDVGH